jgi:ElaA protein
MTTTTKFLHDCQPQEVFDFLHLRAQIFVVEQRCIYLDPDNADRHSLHVLTKDGDKLVGYARVIYACEEIPVRIGRVCVAAEYRQQGIARQLMREAMKQISLRWPGQRICLSAQTYLREFYQSLGFEVCGAIFLEDGLPHVEMRYVQQ